MEGSIILFDLVNNGKSTITRRIMAVNSKVYETLDTDIQKENGTSLTVACLLFCFLKKVFYH